MRAGLLVGIAALLGAAAPPAPATTPLAIGPTLASLRSFAATKGERLWPGFGTAPFEFLLVEPSGETLLCRERMPAGFTAAGRDASTGCPRYTRARGKLPGGLLAAMPLFGPPPTIVMGTPAETGRASADWQRTILHEHLHQWQWTLPGYFARVGALDLAGGDTSGMWMLNFAFPYSDARAGTAYAGASRALAAALAQRGRPGFRAALRRYLSARDAFAAAVGARNWRYMEFQLWQEGVARWTEIELGRAHPDAAVRAGAVALQRRTLAALTRPDLKAQGRELAYPYGAGEAMLLAACGPGWRAAYPRVLELGSLLRAAARRCAP